jgi:hypothetical protein
MNPSVINYAPSMYQSRHDALYPRTLSESHAYFMPRLRYQKVEMPVHPAAKLTRYALSLISNKFPVDQKA